MRLMLPILLAVWWPVCEGATTATAAPRPLVAVPLADVTIDDEFWAPRIETTRKRTLPHNFKMCEETGRLSNFDKAAGRAVGKHEGHFFNDSDVYKVLEAAAYALALERDPKLEKQVDDLIARIAAAQQEDGYLNTYFTLTPTEQRWTNLRVRHELYCAGHLIEAGVAHHRATGKKTLLDAAVRFADLIDALFGAGRRADVPGHEEIELALVKLADLTGAERYRKLAEFFLEQRGRGNGRELYGEYCQDHAPVREHREIVGHAVRAMYLYCGMADVAAVTGDRGHLDAMERIWTDTVGKKMYITGGIGPSSRNEGFTEPYDLPNDSAYAETCASIGMALWNHRLNLLHADARYIDVLERVLYNGVLAGVSLDGEKFFYTNPLASRGRHHRRSWYTCACCPPNVARFLLSLGGRVYARADDAVYVNLFVAGRATVRLPDVTVTLTQETRYPWDGDVRLTVRSDSAKTFDLYVRVPSWCEAPRLEVNGKPILDLNIQRGYVRLQRAWGPADVVRLALPMPVRRIEAHTRVTADRGRVALRRGPLVYCLEAADHGGHVRHLALPRNAKLTVGHRPDLLGGVSVIRGTALAVRHEDLDDWSRRLYRPAAAVEPVAFTAIPYYAWDNREPGEMVVWLPESMALVEPLPVQGVIPSASHCYRGDTVAALHDRLEPSSSDDRAIPRFTWWSRRGTREWVRYDFDRPRKVAWCEVYWFDDEAARGRCRAPASWKVLYLKGDGWEEVSRASSFGTELDRYNRVTFDPVKTGALKIEARLRPELSGGILEWKVGE